MKVYPYIKAGSYFPYVRLSLYNPSLSRSRVNKIIIIVASIIVTTLISLYRIIGIRC